MQQNSSEFPTKLSRSRNVIQPTMNPEQFPRVSNNPRFAITPESMGINLRSDTPTTSKLQQYQHVLTPVAEVKSYNNEQHRKSPMELYTDTKQESDASFQRSYSNMRTYSYDSLKREHAGHCSTFSANRKAELMPEGPSPNTSPQTPQQQWNFGNIMNNECPQQNAKIPGRNNFTQTLKGAEELDKKNVETFGQWAGFQNSTSMPEHSVQKCRSGSDVCADDSAKLNFKVLNDFYAKRIEEIDAQAWGDKDLKIFTYQEWVELLTRINESFLNNIEELEREVCGRLELMQKRVTSNCRHSQGNEVMKCRKDIDTLLKYIKSSNSNKNWDLGSLTLETVTSDQLLNMFDFNNLTIEDNTGDEIKNFNDADVVQRHKLYANMKALAQEVAEKHDEVRELKRQVICLEDEIQKAQKKIQLKDDVIKELRNDLKCANNKISNNSPVDPSISMSPINFENQSSRSANTQMTDNASTFRGDNGSQFDSLSQSELEEQHIIKILSDEMSDLFAISNLNKKEAEHRRQQIRDVVMKQALEKSAAYRKLDFIRRKLIDLESEFCEGKSDCDSGFHSKSENDHFAKLLDAVRQRLRGRNETICELKKKIQKLELDKNELSSRLESEKIFSGRSSDILKQVADLLTDLKCKQFSYTEAYHRDPGQLNPFCEAILEIQNDFKEKEAQLLQALEARNKKNEELTQLLIKSEKDYNQERGLRSNPNDFENIDKTPAALLSSTSSTALLGTTPTPTPTSTTSL